jgi:hypothetical protein
MLARNIDGTLKQEEEVRMTSEWTWKDEFWEAVEITGYLMEGENRAYERDKIKALAKGLTLMLDDHPEVALVEGRESSREDFAMSAVARLLNAFVFNDSGGPKAFREALHNGLRDDDRPKYPPMCIRRKSP